MSKTAVVIGASHAGAQVVTSLRQNGWVGDIVMIGDEPMLPYQRPPLSKGFLAGDKTADALLIRPAAFYEKHAIRYRQGRVVAINRPRQTILLKDGTELAYDRLALCVGAHVRMLDVPGAMLNGVHYVRTLADVQGIRTDLAHAKTAIIIGGGYIGLETAAALRQQGLTVVVLEMAERLLQRVTAPELSAFYARIHTEEGVHIRTGVTISKLIGHDRVQGVQTGDGEIFAADMVVVGVGVVPATELAQAAGLAVDNGIVVDAWCRTNDPLIVAAGDCAQQFNELYQCGLRLESVPNASEQGKRAAAAMCADDHQPTRDDVTRCLPWFWSDQYDLKLQIAGISAGYDQLIIRGDISHGRRVAVFYLKAGRLIAADCVNRPHEFLMSKRVIAEGLTLDLAQLSDETIPVTALIG